MRKSRIDFSCAALNTGRDFRLLDHLAPLCASLDIPLLLTEENNYELCKKYYPWTLVEYIPELEFSLFALAEKYHLLLQSTFWQPEITALIKKVYPHIRFGYCPHGNSDKGHLKPMLNLLLTQDLVLLYGKHMIQRLKKQNLWDNAPPYLLTGNYRFSYYKKHKEFYDELAHQEVFSKLNLKHPTILYAPTWNDDEGSTSFFTACKSLIKELPGHFNLIVKTHPLLEEMDPGRYYATLPELNRDNILLLTEFPPIFGLLSKIAIYIGDASSIGYDFLAFQRPMFFFNQVGLPADHPSRFLHQAGLTIPENTSFFPFIEKHQGLIGEQKKHIQKKIWTLAFGQDKIIQPMKISLEKIYWNFFE